MLRKIRSHLYDIFIAFTRYRSGFSYLWLRYIIARRILHGERVLEKQVTDPHLSVHIVFGHRDIVIACWALASWYSSSSRLGSLSIHSDGSLTSSDLAILKRKFPHSTIVIQNDLKVAAERTLSMYPACLRFFNAPFWQARKLLDTYLAAAGSRVLVIDSDTLWFRDPEALVIASAQNQPVAFMMSNNGTFCRMPFSDGSVLPDSLALLNSGVVFYDMQSFSLDRLEEYLSRINLEKPHHFMEQAGFAYALQNPQELPPSEYTIKGVLEKDATMRHYTGPSRGKFFLRGIPYLRNHSLSHVLD